ncbi:DUF3800 domain-containing protein [Aggregatibacter actinomycetemcomitans]|uniref:DUF3800 domain-containing protein n=1 Tax=Aggregatibacter actinomycetemcomitans TaxID=714 RepID=UPI00197B3169|nr:DUF3800 domain-containing protein [Aggregatibacter actinomycetemcomitans]MBN6063912.1 hypothetical protein [Aggregatibacter actinomycetemcomitans]MBN6081485.1 hypothetical protein [Aggregatibacter actinomycetemcomitans]MBN6083814.1 hypothetical protein [Aggregatibacter actinomycetemcomitans]
MLHLEPSNLELNFYYDETNNIRKFYLDNNKKNYINSEDNPFILGGIAIEQSLLETGQFKQSLQDLFKKWGIQTTQKEVKFKHIAKGDFPTVLKSKKVNYLFDFLNKQDVFIHMHLLDVIHWSLIDIIESTTAFNVCKKFLYIDEHIFDEVKSLLTEIARTFKEDFFRELFELGYPDVTNKKDEFVFLLKKYLYRYSKSIEYKNGHIPPLLLEILWKIFLEFEKDNESNDTFCFLEGELSHKLIENFDSFYFFSIEQLPNSYHFFDEEKQVEERLLKYQNKLNYKFIKSDDNKLIQLSDIFVGFLRCLFNYLSEVDYSDVETNYKNLSDIQKKCLRDFFKIYEKSVTKDDRMVIFTGSIFDFFKFNVLRDLCKT